MALLNGLQDSLDLSYGKIPEDLYALYDYMKYRLMDASRKYGCNSGRQLVAQLFITIKSAWDSIPQAERMQALAQQLAKDAAG